MATIGGAVTPVSPRAGKTGRDVSIGWEPAALAIALDGRPRCAPVAGLNGRGRQTTGS